MTSESGMRKELTTFSGIKQNYCKPNQVMPIASLLLAMLLSLVCIGVYAHDNRQHPIEAQYRQLSTLNTQSLLRYGETQTDLQADDRALVAFNILMSRYTAQMERQDKYACAKAACHIGDIY